METPTISQPISNLSLSDLREVFALTRDRSSSENDLTQILQGLKSIGQQLL